jgi:membrane protein DedA with SNARE-associated domain
MPWLRFLILNALGGIIWAIVYGDGAYLAGDRITKLSRPVDLGMAVAAIVAVVTLFLVLRRQQEMLSAKAEAAMPGPPEAP